MWDMCVCVCDLCNDVGHVMCVCVCELGDDVCYMCICVCN